MNEPLQRDLLGVKIQTQKLQVEIPIVDARPKFGLELCVDSGRPVTVTVALAIRGAGSLHFRGRSRPRDSGSSRQSIMVVTRGKIRSCLLSPREAARLMGVSDDYILPTNYNEAAAP